MALVALSLGVAEAFVLQPPMPLSRCRASSSLATCTTGLSSCGSKAARTTHDVRAAADMHGAQRKYPWWRRAWRKVALATTVAGFAVAMRAPGAISPASAVTTAPRTGVTRKVSKKASGSQRALSTVLLCGGFAFICYRTVANEDEEEVRRIKKETDKMDKLEKEFTDIDGGVTVDEDLFASLKKRLNGTNTDEGDGESSGDGSGPTGGSGGDGDLPDGTGGGSSAVLERPSDGEQLEAPSPGASAEDIERLKRMFGGTSE